MGADAKATPEITLQPVASPSILGPYAFSGSLLPVAAWLTHWYGTPQSPPYLAPFVLMFGGVAQFTAAIWAFVARQWVTTAISGLWACEHFAWGVLNLLFAAHVLPEPSPFARFPEFGMWYVPLALFTLAAAVPAYRLGVPSLLVSTLGGSGAALTAVAESLGNDGLRVVAGYVLIATSVAGWYGATALLLRAMYGRNVLPMGQPEVTQEMPEVDAGEGEAGVARAA